MNFLKALAKASASLIVDAVSKSSKQRNRKLAYIKTGQQIEEAKAKHIYISGSQTYHKNLNKRNRTTQKHTSFIKQIIENI